MKIEYIDNACCVYERDNFRLLADPWLTNGAFEGSWYHQVGAVRPHADLFTVDALYISHLHPDHYDPETLKKFRKDIPVVVLDHGANFLHRKLEELGFNNLVKVRDGARAVVGPFLITMYAPFVKHPFEESVLGNLLDSAIVIDDGVHVVLNANDNTPDENAARSLREEHGPFDLAQLKYALAGPYPSCFLDIPHFEKLQEKERLLKRLKEKMDSVAMFLDADAVQSFAGSYCLAGTLARKNEYLAVDGLDLSKIPEGKPYNYETEEMPDEDLYDLCEQAREAMWKRQFKFDFFPDTTVSIRLKSGSYFRFNFSKLKCDRGFEADLICIMDPRLLKRILTKQTHWNNAEVGCHIDFIREPNKYQPDVHTMMCFFHP